jgi:hypothetical protein
MENNDKIKELENKLLKYELQEVGIYTPKHILGCKTEFVKTIKENLKQQKSCSKVKVMFDTSGDMQELLLANFNFKCSEVVKELNGYNLKSAKCKIRDYANELINLCNKYQIKIRSQRLFELKIEQLTLETEYLLFQADEKFRRKMQAKNIREQRKADRDWFVTLKNLQQKFDTYIDTNDCANAEKLNERIEEAKTMLRERKAGWVYIISNEDMKEGLYKIGTTRRPNPVVRINELSNASHAFKFKIHAIVYSEDCFALESNLHKRFAQYRVNKDNFHKEFFAVSLDEIQRVLKEEFNIDVEMQEDIYSDNEALTEFYNFVFKDEEDVD